ncbi:MAG: hypothetical protein M1831_001334 [Alyxoria varia]|nr:MAG: hypothetical protein M1831_001334 [Alyxoria varia]
MLKKKPVLAIDAPEIPRKGDPYANNEPEEFVASIGGSHRLLLKKYSVYRPELVLPTTTFGLQTDDLDKDDIRAMWTVLKEFTLFPSMAIYNCGFKAGSTQAHKHMEFIPLPDFLLWPARANSTTDVIDLSNIVEDVATKIELVPFQHYVLQLPVGATVDQVFDAYESLLEHSRQAVSAADVGTSDYNFILTTHWIAVIPRRSAGSKGPFGADAAGMLGMVSIPNYSHLKWWSKLGYTRYLGQLGIPPVEEISKTVKSFHEREIPFRVYHGSTNSTRIINHDPKKIVDISGLNNVLKVDTIRKTALVEANVPMDQLVDATLEHDLLPPVVPEFPGITVGGSYAGTAGESSSFKHGCFDRTINWLQMILANGEVVKASPTERSDLFYGAVGAFGTVGVLTLLEVQLCAAGKFVELTYLPVSSSDEGVSKLRKCTQEPFDFVDGIMFSRDCGAIAAGRTTSELNHPIQRFSRPQDPWFYLHCRSKVKTKSSSDSSEVDVSNTTECVPIRDYLFRYDRGAFWMGAYAFDMFYTPFNTITRFVLDPYLHTRKMYEALHHSGLSQRYIIQDLAIPVDYAETFMEFVDNKFGIYPLWLCPLRGDSKAPLHATPTNCDLLINVGVWGVPKSYQKGDFDMFVSENREIEDRVRQLGGLKWLYAHCYYTEDEFWQIYDRKGYDELRSNYGAQGLPDIYQKIKKADKFVPTSRVRAVAKAVLRRESLLQKR